MSEESDINWLRQSEQAMREDRDRLLGVVHAQQAEEIKLRAEVRFLTGASENAMLREQHISERKRREACVASAKSAAQDLATYLRCAEPSDHDDLIKRALSELQGIHGVDLSDDDYDDD